MKEARCRVGRRNRRKVGIQGTSFYGNSGEDTDGESCQPLKSIMWKANPGETEYLTNKSSRGHLFLKQNRVIDFNSLLRHISLFESLFKCSGNLVLVSSSIEADSPTRFAYFRF